MVLRQSHGYGFQFKTKSVDTRFQYGKSIEYFKTSTMVIYARLGFKIKRKIFPKFLRPKRFKRVNM